MLDQVGGESDTKLNKGNFINLGPLSWNSEFSNPKRTLINGANTLTGSFQKM